ncbi:hypothetical protein KLA_07747, partial [Cellulophaga geojensis KL-A]
RPNPLGIANVCAKPKNINFNTVTSVIPTVVRHLKQTMNIELYPEFDKVFTDKILEGIFYPLCSLTLKEYPNKVFHFISSNGMWMDENHKTESNSSDYTLFEFQENKYKFNGDIRLYKGYEQAKNILDKLQKDFDKNGRVYLDTKTQTDDYIRNQKQNFNIESNDDFDIDYYLQTFYEFSINKLNFKLNKRFGEFRHIIDGWGKSDKSSIIYEIKNDNSTGFTDIEVNKEYIFPKTIEIEEYAKIGFIIGYEFFTDGNDTYLAFDEDKERVICINHYS